MDANKAPVRRERELTSRLRLVCGERHVLTDRAHLQVYRTAGSRVGDQLPAAAVLPSSPREVQGVVRVCHELGVPVLTRGAGTDPGGGARPVAGAVVVVLSRMRRLLDVDRGRGSVRAEAGVPLGAIARALGVHGDGLLHEAGAAVATLGGAIAAAGGLADHVAGLELVIADGSLVALERDRPGYDLIGPFVGCAGALGIAVVAHLRVPAFGGVPLDAAGGIAERGDGWRRLRDALDPDRTLTPAASSSAPV